MMAKNDRSGASIRCRSMKNSTSRAMPDAVRYSRARSRRGKKRPFRYCWRKVAKSLMRSPTVRMKPAMPRGTRHGRPAAHSSTGAGLVLIYHGPWLARAFHLILGVVALLRIWVASNAVGLAADLLALPHVRLDFVMLAREICGLGNAQGGSLGRDRVQDLGGTPVGHTVGAIFHQEVGDLLLRHGIAARILSEVVVEAAHHLAPGPLRQKARQIGHVAGGAFRLPLGVGNLGQPAAAAAPLVLVVIREEPAGGENRPQQHPDLQGLA